MEAGAIERGPVQPLAHLLLAALHEGAMLIAGAEDVGAARKEVGASIDLLLTGLRRRGEQL